MKKQTTKHIVGFKIRGTSSLILNAFADKSVLQMLQKHMGLTVGRENKVPRQVLESAIIRNTAGQVVVPAVGIKKAMVSASSLIKSYDRKKKVLMISFHVVGQSVPISWQIDGLPANEGYVPRMDVTRTSGIQRSPDIRFRPEFPNWTAKVAISYSPDILNADAVADLLDRAGSVGLCEWRQEKGGTFGSFVLDSVLDADEVDDVIAACSKPIKSTPIPDWALDLNIDTETLARMFDGSRAGAEEGLSKVKGEEITTTDEDEEEVA